MRLSHQYVGVFGHRTMGMSHRLAGTAVGGHIVGIPGTELNSFLLLFPDLISQLYSTLLGGCNRLLDGKGISERRWVIFM